MLQNTYTAVERGVSWSVYEHPTPIAISKALMHNLKEWQAKSIAAILNQGDQ
jgi:hypothetical protein